MEPKFDSKAEMPVSNNSQESISSKPKTTEELAQAGNKYAMKDMQEASEEYVDLTSNGFLFTLNSRSNNFPGSVVIEKEGKGFAIRLGRDGNFEGNSFNVVQPMNPDGSRSIGSEYASVTQQIRSADFDKLKVLLGVKTDQALIRFINKFKK
jgi:hypothetical protein